MGGGRFQMSCSRVVHYLSLISISLPLVSCGGGGSGNNQAPSPPATASISASALVVANGGHANISWSSHNATGCVASGAWSGALAINGSQNVGPLTTNSIYSISCSGPGGTSSMASVTINVTPTAMVTANPSVVATGGSSMLTWSSTNATSCTASAAWSGTLPTSGNQGTGALSVSTNYSLTCSGAGGTSNVAQATVTISNVTMALSPAFAAVSQSQTQQFTATVPGGGAASWMVDGISGGNSTVGLINSGGLYTPGMAAGVHTIVAISNANSSQTASAQVAVSDLAGVYTYHNDLERDGANTKEYALTPSNVATATFGKLFACTVDGAVYAQPLWVAGLTINGAIQNVAFVATAHDSLFAFDADATPCATLWQVSLIDGAHGATSGETTVPSGTTGYLVGGASGDITPETGVIGTPVIDPVNSILYVVSKSVSADQKTFYQRLHAIDLLSGREKPGSPVLIAATYPGTGDGGNVTTFNPRQQNQRAGLALVNGVVYISWSSHEDVKPYYGWIIGYSYSGTSFTQTAALNVTPNVGMAGIWMGGGAPAADSSNNLYLLTGNGGFDANSASPPNNDFGDSLLQLTSSLSVAQYFTPSDQLADEDGDNDFGSGGTAILADLSGEPVAHLLMGGGKDGALYVLNRDRLGGLGDSAAVQKIDTGYGLFATGAYWNFYFYIAGLGGPITAYQLNPSLPLLTAVGASRTRFGFPGSTPSISAFGSQNGVLWALDNSQYCTNQSNGCGPAVLHAYSATNLTQELWNSSMTAGDSAGNAVKFAVPTVANGKVYIGTRGNNVGGVYGSTSVSGELDVYGLTYH